MTIEQLIQSGRAQRIPPDEAAQRRLLADADLHLRTAASAQGGGDLAGAYQVAYDAARKALTALLNSRGLRTKGLGAHASLGLVPRSANAGHWFDDGEVARDIAIASAIVDAARVALE